MIRRGISFKHLITFSLIVTVIYCIIYFKNDYLLDNMYMNFRYSSNNFLKNVTCPIPYLDVFAPEVIKHVKKVYPLKCPTKENDWIYVDKGYVYFKPDLVKNNHNIFCDINYVIRKDDYSNILEPETKMDYLNQKIKLKNDFFVASCKIPNKKESFEKIFASVKYDEKLAKKSNQKDALNVLFFGMDSLSRVHFIRQLQKSYNFITSKYNATVLQIYNIVGDGSSQALIPILTGLTQLDLPSTAKKEKNAKHVDIYPFIWKNFSDYGYLTQYGEDTPHIGTFTYKLKGFINQPTDFYMRPFYIQAWKNHFSYNNLCYAGRPRHMIFLDWVKHFFKTYPNTPKYAFNFYTEISHDDFNLVQIIDNDLINWLNDLDKMNLFNNTIVILMSDHGARFSIMRSTLQGKLEERLPFFSFILPNWFKNKFPNAYKHLKENANSRLLTPFDIYSTLLTVLTHFNKGKDVDEIEYYDPKNLPRSLSIFKYIPENRSCEDAKIENHWCACLQWFDLKTTDSIVIESAKKFVDFLNNYNKKFTDLCNTLEVKDILKAQKIMPRKDLLNFKKTTDENDFIPDLSDKTKVKNEIYQLQLIVSPSDGLYEVTIHYNKENNKFIINESEISRINKYGNQDYCIHDTESQLRKYCHCKE